MQKKGKPNGIDLDDLVSEMFLPWLNDTCTEIELFESTEISEMKHPGQSLSKKDHNIPGLGRILRFRPHRKQLPITKSDQSIKEEHQIEQE